MSVRTRFAPSPTGVLHLGSIRTALFNWLFARHNKGTFILRIEDTDRERSTEDNVRAILEGLEWLGLDWDEGPFFQSARTERYLEVAEQWVAEGRAYHCYCSKQELNELRNKQMAAGERVRYDGRCRDAPQKHKNADHVIRFKNPRDGDVVVRDAVRGAVQFANEQLDDLIIVRSDRTPTYNFTVVVDDFDMAITHVIRGDDHLNNTPRQMNMILALGQCPPAYAHLPMILGPDGAKLSKRHGAVDIREYEKLGYLREALLNYLARLGWSYGDQEIFSIEELVELFDIMDVNQSASCFDPTKMLWLNQQHIKSTPAEDLGDKLTVFLQREGLELENGPRPAEVADAFRVRSQTLLQMAKSATYFYSDFNEFDASAAAKNLKPGNLRVLLAAREALQSIEEWTTPEISVAVQNIAAQFSVGIGKIGQPIRVAVTGSVVSPPIDTTICLVGKERVIKRLDKAIEYIQSRIDD